MIDSSVDNVCFRRVCRERLLIPLIFPLGVNLTMSVSARLVKVLILRVGGFIFIRNKDAGQVHTLESSCPVHSHPPTHLIRHTPLAKCKSKSLHVGRYL